MKASILTPFILCLGIVPAPTRGATLLARRSTLELRQESKNGRRSYSLFNTGNNKKIPLTLIARDQGDHLTDCPLLDKQPKLDKPADREDIPVNQIMGHGETYWWIKPNNDFEQVELHAQKPVDTTRYFFKNVLKSKLGKKPRPPSDFSFVKRNGKQLLRVFDVAGSRKLYFDLIDR